MACSAPCYFIDTSDGEHLFVDYEGHRFTDDEAAQLYVLQALPDMARRSLREGDQQTFSAAVRNEAAEVIYRATLTFKGEWTRI